MNGARIINHPDDGKPCCNITNAAKFLRMNRTTLINYLYKYTGIYHLPSHKILKTTYIYVEDIKKFFERTRNAPNGANQIDSNDNVLEMSKASNSSNQS